LRAAFDRGGASRVLLLLALAACDRPRPLVFCHNANCTGDPDPDRDDTIEGLRAGLALEVDGMEIDLVWHQDRCVFAHDAEGAAGRPDASVALDEILAWRADHALPGLVLIELKPTGEPEALADCAAAAADRLAAGGLGVRLDSSDPAVLRALAAGGRDFVLYADFSAPRPLTETWPLADHDAPLDGLVVHPRWVTSASLAVARERDLDLIFWSVLLTTETLDAIERWEPLAVTTGDAPFLRAWIEW
jgi:hypothetical protein